MFYVAIDYEAVAGLDVEGLAGDIDVQRTAHNIDELMMGMAVARADPALFEEVSDEHQVIGVGEDLADHSGLRSEAFGVLIS